MSKAEEIPALSYILEPLREWWDLALGVLQR